MNPLDVVHILFARPEEDPMKREVTVMFGSDPVQPDPLSLSNHCGLRNNHMIIKYKAGFRASELFC